MKELEKFGIDLEGSALLEIALTHTSYANEHNSVSYERLEFLGDAVLELVSSDYIYKTQNLKEGDMSKKRSLYVCENALYEYAKELNLANYIKVGNSIQTPNKTVVSFRFMPQKYETGDAILGSVEEVWKDEISYNAYKTISSKTYYRYRDQLYKWTLQKNKYYTSKGEVNSAKDVKEYYEQRAAKEALSKRA